MFTVIFDHDMSWDDGCDSDTHCARFNSMADAYAFAAHVDQRDAIESDECRDSWVVRRVMYNDTLVPRDVWSVATPVAVTPDAADELLASDLGCPIAA